MKHRRRRIPRADSRADALARMIALLDEAKAGCGLVVGPDGQVVARAATEGDELLVHACDMGAAAFGKAIMFDLKRHRRIEHYRRITGQTDVIYPDGRPG